MIYRQCHQFLGCELMFINDFKLKVWSDSPLSPSSIIWILGLSIQHTSLGRYHFASLWRNMIIQCIDLWVVKSCNLKQLRLINSTQNFEVSSSNASNSSVQIMVVQTLSDVNVWSKCGLRIWISVDKYYCGHRVRLFTTMNYYYICFMTLGEGESSKIVFFCRSTF